MAPIRKRSSLRARAAAAGVTPSPSTLTPQTPAVPQRLSKKTKRSIKHNTLMSRVRDAGVSKQNTKKRRRPGKKLPAAEGLGGLRDALPNVAHVHGDDEDGGDENDEWEGLSDDDIDLDVTGDGMPSAERVSRKRRRRRVPGGGSGGGKMAMHSLKHRPGAMKRKERLQKQEVLRFGRNLAQLAANTNPSGGAAGDGNGNNAGRGDHDTHGEKWAALRNFINTTMERDAAFAVR